MKMSLKYWYNKIRQRPILMISICCIVPLTLLFVVIYIFGVRSNYLFWLIILLCPLMHFWMMRDMYKKKDVKGENERDKEMSTKKENEKKLSDFL